MLSGILYHFIAFLCWFLNDLVHLHLDLCIISQKYQNSENKSGNGLQERESIKIR